MEVLGILPSIHVGGLDGVPRSWLQAGLTLATAGIWRVKPAGGRSLSFLRKKRTLHFPRRPGSQERRQGVGEGLEVHWRGNRALHSPELVPRDAHWARVWLFSSPSGNQASAGGQWSQAWLEGRPRQWLA